MPELNAFALSGILILISYLPLFLLFAIKGSNRTTKLYSLHLLSVTFWGLGSFLIGVSSSSELSLHIWRYSYAAVLCIPVFFQHTVSEITGRRKGAYLTFCYLQLIVFILLIISGGIASDVGINFGNLYFFKYSHAYLASMLVWIYIVVSAHYHLFKHHTDNKSLKQRTALYWASLGFVGGLFNFVPILGIHLYPLGNYLITIYVFIITYAIFNNQFLNIKLVIKEGITYSLLITIVTTFYVACVVLLEKAFQAAIGYDSLWISTATAFILGLLITPLRNKLQKFVDRIFFKKDAQEIILENKQLLQQVTQAEKYRTLATLASGIAHEIRNPLTIIKTFTEFLPKKCNEIEFIEKYSRLTKKEIVRIEELVSQLLNYSKPIPPKFRQTRIKSLFEDSLDVLSNQLLSKKINLKLHLDIDDDMEIKVDRNQLHQAILNIVQNAIEAMPEGGTLYVNAQRSSTSTGGKIKLSFRDTGPGIDHEQLKQIFDPFFTQKDFGTGLGLAIVQSIIENHHGKIIARSKVGEGTEMIIELPSA